ncbi:FadR/GntR family transcriptional regulator [Amnibacterium kyonggiense]|uniref:DNA-binding FadR family transcriptional regulator n=1 Tax=Amnibacterium kyonggiense TaxID=595671 RepID=A0A4R7FLG7_9MICO|nr:FCD domain-containing protein [Amnibacterium kyonggiense]TDS77245.1 DNA-binding FadR family transcriptional regulator [Amnibacterium kyonggiense]
MSDSRRAEVAALRPLIAETAAARIADRFITAFALGQFVVGQKLPSLPELAAMLEVSQTTVREAISRLAALGYVRVQRGRAGGTFVVSQWGPASDSGVRRALGESWGTLQETLDFRSLVEQQIARTAAQRIVPEDEERIRLAVEAYGAAGTDRNASRLADLEVHQSIAAATHNRQLAELSMRLQHEVGLGFHGEPFSEDVRRRAVEQHAVLAAAVLDRDPDRAAQLAREHFALTEELLNDLHDRTTASTTSPASTTPATTAEPPPTEGA